MFQVSPISSRSHRHWLTDMLLQSRPCSSQAPRRRVRLCGRHMHCCLTSVHTLYYTPPCTALFKSGQFCLWPQFVTHVGQTRSTTVTVCWHTSIVKLWIFTRYSTNTKRGVVGSVCTRVCSKFLVLYVSTKNLQNQMISDKDVRKSKRETFFLRHMYMYAV